MLVPWLSAWIETAAKVCVLQWPNLNTNLSISAFLSEASFITKYHANRCQFSHHFFKLASHVNRQEGQQETRDWSIKTPSKLRNPPLPSNTGEQEGVSLHRSLFVWIPNWTENINVISAGCEEKMYAIQVISLALLSVLAANAQVIMPGRCPKPAVQENFDAARVKTTPFLFFFLTLM